VNLGLIQVALVGTAGVTYPPVQVTDNGDGSFTLTTRVDRSSTLSILAPPPGTPIAQLIFPFIRQNATSGW